MNRLIKDPASKLDYVFDWTEYLATDGDTIASYVVTVTTGLTKDSDSGTGGVVTVWVSGGSAEVEYIIDCTITTAAGRIVSRKIRLLIQDR